MTDWFFDPLSPGVYDLIVVDPPWRFRTWTDTNQAKSASRYYSLMTAGDIEALPVKALARSDCLLLLWSTGAMMPQALDAMRAWGFTYKSQMVWRKVTAKGLPRMGTGYWARSMHEPILIGTRGNPSKSSAFPSLFNGVARQHSRKPEEFYDLVDTHAGPAARRCDIFARQSRPGWDSFGDQMGHFP